MLAAKVASPTPPAQGPRWLPLELACRRLRVRSDSVIELIHSGHLTGYLSRPRWFVLASSLRAYRKKLPQDAPERTIAPTGGRAA